MDDLFTMMAANRSMLILAPLIGGMCSLLSVYIVLRRMALISEGVSHAGFGGIAVALLIGYFFPSLDMQRTQLGGETTGSAIWWQVITGAFCLGTALLIGYTARKKRVSEDSAIGIFLVTAVALGELLLKVRQLLPAAGSSTPPNVESLLFGDFSSVSRTDTYVAGATAVIVFAVVGAFYHQFLYTTLDEEMARVNGVNTRLINTLQLLLISLVIVVCGRMVGFLMITALTIIPGATANMLSRRFAGVLGISLLIGTLGTFAATFATLIGPFRKLPPGPLVVLLLFVLFAIVWSFRHFVKPRAVEVEFHPIEQKVPGAFGHGHSH